MLSRAESANGIGGQSQDAPVAANILSFVVPDPFQHVLPHLLLVFLAGHGGGVGQFNGNDWNLLEHTEIVAH